jgi:hypothetical protein
MTLDTKFAAQVRAQLVDTAAGNSPLARRTHRTRIAVGLAAAVTAAGLLTAGAIIATGIPGSHIVTPVGAAVTQSHIGTATVELGPRPDGVSTVSFSITCTSAGAFELTHPESDEGTGTSWVCSDTPGLNEATEVDPYDITLPVGHVTYIKEQPLEPGATSFIVTTDPGTTWTISARYATSVTTEWGVNENGQTYGTPNENGMPDLQAAQATNGKIGYIYFDDLMPTDPALQGDHDIPVYDTDGTTQIGVFHLGNG